MRSQLAKVAVGALALVGGFGVAVTAASDSESQSADDRAIFCQQFVPNMEAADYFAKWTRSAKIDAQTWDGFRTGVCDGGPDPLVPSMNTLFGRALTDAGLMALDAAEPPPTTTTTTTTDTTTTTTTTETPPPTTEGLSFPASFKIFGGNESTAFTTHDFVVASDMTAGVPADARANGNPSLIAMSHMSVDPAQSDWRARRGFALTYGGGLRGGNIEGLLISPWAGVNDTLSPSPQGVIRGYDSSVDDGCLQSDGLMGFRLWSDSTAELVKKAAWYGWKVGQGAARGYNGIWSDNLFPPNLLTSGNNYGACGSGHSVDWSDNVFGGSGSILNSLKALGVPLVGGNTAYRANTQADRASFNAALLENLEVTIAQGPAAWANTLAEITAWQNAGPAPRYMAIMHIAQQTETAKMRFGLALATIAGAAYMPYNTSVGHSALYLPAEMKRNGVRHYLGVPITAAQRFGNTWQRTFRDSAGVSHTVSANFDTQTGTFG